MTKRRRIAGLVALIAVGLLVFAVVHRSGGAAAPPAPPAPAAPPVAASPPPASGTTIVGRTFTTYAVPAGTDHVTYERCTFVGGGPTTAVLTLAQPCHDLTFRDCTIASGGGWNGSPSTSATATSTTSRSSAVASPGNAERGSSARSARFGDTVGYTHIDLTDCSFAPQAAEAISYDGGAGCRECTIAGCVIEGAGDSGRPNGNGLEINGPTFFTVRDTTIYGCRDAGFDLNCQVADCGWVFQNDVVDFSQLRQAVPVDARPPA